MEDESRDKDLEESKYRSKLSEERTELSKTRTLLSEERTQLSKQRVVLAEERNEYALNRTHLANQRTFLAWIRTSLALIGFGFGLAKFISSVKEIDTELGMTTGSDSVALTIGLLMIVLGVVIVILAYDRYKATEKQFASTYESYNWLALLILVSIVLAGFITIYELLVNTSLF